MFDQGSIGGLILAEERFMQVTLRNMVTAYGNGHGLKAIHLHVLGMLGFEDGQTMKQLGDLTRMKASNLSPICSLLEERGLIRRVRNESDGRSNRLFLTAEGIRMLEGLDEWLNKVLSCAGDDNARLHDDIRKGFEAFRMLVDTACETGARQ